jgi:hypothetical protein
MTGSQRRSGACGGHDRGHWWRKSKEMEAKALILLFGNAAMPVSAA